jgi:hypothetical protein
MDGKWMKGGKKRKTGTADIGLSLADLFFVKINNMNH